MSMLAERRDKKKWSVDPNGTNWSKDGNKFGMKMLERMGWTKGKGLGANEDGRVEHIKIKHKNDNRGVGCTVKHEKNWVAHQDDFASLLAQLNDHHSDQTEVEKKTEVSSLEKKSKSQKRVHYHKFARGKDLSNYRETDLAAIFGKTVSQSAPVTPVNLSEDEASDADSTSSCPEKVKKKKSKKNKTTDKTSNEASNHVTSAMSVQEYFAQRMAAIKNKAVSCPASTITGKEDIDEETEKQEQEDASTVIQNSTTESTKKVKKKRKKSKTKEVEESQECISNSATPEENEETTEKPLRKKKKSKSKTVDKNTDSNESESLQESEPKTKKKKSKKRRMKDSNEEGLSVSKKSKKETTD